MKFVFFLGALALLAVSSATENENKDMDDTVKDIHIREVRNTEKRKVQRKKPKKAKLAKGRVQRKKPKKAKQAKRARKLSKKRAKKGRRKIVDVKGKAGKKRRRNGKGKNLKNKRRRKMKNKGKKKKISRKNKTEERQSGSCAEFKENAFNNLKSYRYARNQLQKAKRVKRFYELLDKKSINSATAFQNCSDFFKNCKSTAGSEIYDVLSKCNVTAKEACDPSWILDFELFTELPTCIADLELTVETADNCTKATCQDKYCIYEPVPVGDCDYKEFERAVADFKKGCTKVDISGSFGACSRLLKDSWGTARTCPVVTTLRSRLQNFKSWKKN